MDVTGFSVEYSIDEQNRLVSFNNNWNRFARENDSAHLTSEAIAGQSIFDHIAGESLRQLWQYIIENIRKKQSSAEFDFRCDSTEIKRFMKMHVWFHEGRVNFSSTILRTKTAAGLRIFQPHAAHSAALILACSWCKKIKADETTWFEPEVAVEKLHLLENDLPPNISHGICPECYSRVLDGFENELKN